MTEPAQPQPAPPAQPDPVPASQPVTIEPVDDGTANATPGPATSAAAATDGPPSGEDDAAPGNVAATGFSGEAGPQPASPAETQASGTDTQPADDGPAEPGPGGAGATPVVPGAPAEVVDLGSAHIATQLRTGGATSNESPSLPQNIQSAGAKAHAGLDHLLAIAKDDGESAEAKLPQVISIAEALRADLDRYVPESIRSAAMADVERMLRKLHL